MSEIKVDKVKGRQAAASGPEVTFDSSGNISFGGNIASTGLPIIINTARGGISKEDDLIFLIDYEKCFNKLGDRCKTIIKERAKKSKYNEISEIINIPPKNVPGIISRCVKQLNLCLHVDR